MPELPEIETVRLQLQKVLVGQKLVSVTVNSNRTVKSDLDVLRDKSVKGVKRAGKVLLIDFGQDLLLGFHFKMTGQLIYEEDGKRVVGGHPTEDFVNKMPSKHTRVIFQFDKGTLYFNDQRLFGWIEINPKFVDKLGPEVFSLTVAQFSGLFSKTSRPIKIALMDQEIISGVGNIYANDALWESRIDPRTPSDHLSFDHLSLLLEKIKLVLNEGIKYGGATAADAKYMNLHGLGGHYQEHFRVYDREGELCKRPACRQAGVKIEKFVLGGRGTYYCPSCQV
ncbi:MAG: formamidopyrimidine-DNA glycosidase [Microgenomates group bacterium Gr01-1014_16]|nr:MAG: formamidopyrimidine-DNA glycosidase [Microgenomates group bacterium Gr01-1014_16]